MEDRRRLLVVPVVQDRLEQVCVRALGHLVEEAAGDDAAAVGQAGGPQQLLRPVEHVRLIEKDAVQRLIRGKQRGEEGPEAAADVDEPPEPAEVIGLEQRCIRPAGQSHHRRVEDGTFLRVLGPVRPDVDAVDGLEGVLAALDAVEEVTPRLPVVRTSDEGGPASKRVGRVGSEAVAERRQRETIDCVLVEDTDCGERP